MPKLFRHLLRTLRPARLLAAAGLGAPHPLRSPGGGAAHAHDPSRERHAQLRGGRDAPRGRGGFGRAVYGRLREARRGGERGKSEEPQRHRPRRGRPLAGTLFFSLLGPDFITALTNRMPWDAMTLGNHEFDLGCERLAEVLPQESSRSSPPTSHAVMKAKTPARSKADSPARW